MKRLRKILNPVVFIGNMILLILFIFSCFTPYVNTGIYWWIALLGLTFPVLLFAVFCLLIYYLIKRSKWAFLNIIILILGIQQIRATVAFNAKNNYLQNNTADDIKILQWNVKSWDQLRLEQSGDFHGESFQPKMMSFLKESNADIMCFEEFFEGTDTSKFKSNIAQIKAIGYPYFYFRHGDLLDGIYFSGDAIFSKFTILDTASINGDSIHNNAILIYADVQLPGKKIRVFATHLQSVGFTDDQYTAIQDLKKGEESGIKQSRTIIGKLKRAYGYRYKQSLIVKQHLNESPWPTLLCGDFNDVPNSNTYFTISKNMQDAFLKKGTFIGRTFRYIFPTLRIDYVLTDKNFEIKNFKVLRIPYSDHYPVESIIRLK
ncbi:MAG: endonuclease/exonuclease/phosphatase family protein [Ginsengibacter sp.]